MPSDAQPHKDRIYAVTGAGSGIGAAVAEGLRERGARVIACDLRDGDVAADLATADGRTALVDGVARLSGGRLDGIVANAGGGRAATMLALNYFGAVATLDGLRPLLAGSAAPRAVAVSSIQLVGRDGHGHRGGVASPETRTPPRPPRATWPRRTTRVGSTAAPSWR